MVQSEAAGGLHKCNRSPSASSLLGRMRDAEGSCGHSSGPYRLCCGGLSSQQTALAPQRDGPSGSHPNSGMRTTNFLPGNPGGPTEVTDPAVRA